MVIRDMNGRVTSARERARELVLEALERGLEAQWHELETDAEMTAKERLMVKQQIIKLLSGCLLKVRTRIGRR